MKSIKMLGLIVVAILVASALAGVSSASASTTQLCKRNVTVCPESETYSKGTILEAASSGKIVLKGGGLESTCSSTLKIETLETEHSGGPISAEVPSMTLTGCTGNCTTSEVTRLPFKASVAPVTPYGSGQVTISAGAGGNPRVVFHKCGSFQVTCTYETSEINTTLKGGTPASLTVNNAQLSVVGGGAGCAAAKWEMSGTYEVSSPQPLFVLGAAGTTLCKESGVTPCPGKNTYPSGTTVEAKLKTGNFTFEATGNEVSCSGSTLSGKTQAESGSPLPLQISTLTFSGCGGSCKTIEATNLSYGGGLAWLGGGNGLLLLGTNPKLKLGCPFGSTCTYEASEAGLSLEGGNPASLVASKVPMHEVGGKIICADNATFSATYEITSPKPAFLIST